MKYLDNNDLNPKKIYNLLNNSIVVDETGYSSEKKHHFNIFINFENDSQKIFLINAYTKERSKQYTVKKFINQYFIYESSKIRRKNVKSYKHRCIYKLNFLNYVEEIFLVTPAITKTAKEKIVYILKNFFI